MAIFTGAGVAIVTPFNEDGSINYDRLDELIEFHCEHKTDSIVICGTTGESATMTEEEHMQCVKFTIDRVNKRVPVIAGTGSNCTRTAIDMSKEASEYGADGLLLVTPYYNKATQNGLIGHFSAVAKEVTAPIIMYSVASRTGCNIEPATAAKLVNPGTLTFRVSACCQKADFRIAPGPEAHPVKPGICLTVLLQPEKCQRLILKSPCLHDTEGFIKLRKSRP